MQEMTPEEFATREWDPCSVTVYPDGMRIGNYDAEGEEEPENVALPDAFMLGEPYVPSEAQDSDPEPPVFEIGEAVLYIKVIGEPVPGVVYNILPSREHPYHVAIVARPGLHPLAGHEEVAGLALMEEELACYYGELPATLATFQASL